jgi:hypothetical protein
LREHLFTGGKPAPDEYVRLVFCRDVYHCPPSVFYEQPWRWIVEDMEMMAEEANVQKAKATLRGR